MKAFILGVLLVLLFALGLEANKEAKQRAMVKKQAVIEQILFEPTVKHLEEGTTYA